MGWRMALRKMPCDAGMLTVFDVPLIVYRSCMALFSSNGNLVVDIGTEGRIFKAFDRPKQSKAMERRIMHVCTSIASFDDDSR